jgi:hypothetical protein
MTSQINPLNIDGNYPVAGVPNNTQGFRDNFTNTQTNFEYAADEITELQNKAVLKSALTGGVLDNNMNDGLIYAVQLSDVSYKQVDITATSGAVTIDYSAANYQAFPSVTGSIVLGFTNWPAAGTVGTLTLAITVTNTAFTLTLPAAVSLGTTGIQGYSAGVITFAAAGTYQFEFSTVDGGTTITVSDLTRPLNYYTNPVTIASTTVSTSTTTGALRVAGGAGVNGNLYVGGNIVGNILVTGVNVTGNVTGNVLIGNAGIMPNLTVNHLSSDDSTFVTINDGLDIRGDLNVAGNITPAAANKIGGIAPGPGINISNTGLLTIDSAGLPISFGDFFANVNQLSMVNANEDMFLVAQGTGNINLVGGVEFFKPNGFPPSGEPFFRAKNDGQLRILVPAEDPIEGGVEIIGSSTGNYIAPGAPGTMLQLTGNPGIPTRLYMDGNAEYASFVARRYNGNVAAPTQVLAGQDVLRINSTAATNLGGGNVGNVAMAQIRTTALENQTSTAQGSSITFTVTPIGSAASARVDVANVTVANGVTATKFTTAGTVSATGNITGGNVLTGGLISATGNITAGNVAATNYTGKVTQSIRDAGNVTGTTVTLDMTTDDLVRCSFANGTTTVAFSNIIPGRTVTLLASKTDAGTDNINTGISAQNMSNGDASTPVDGLCTAILTYYSLGTTTTDIFCSITYL